MEERIRKLAKEHDIDDSKLESMFKYIRELLKTNEQINLTSIKDYETALSIHLEDSLLGYSLINSAPDGLYGDLGSGCGVPGVLLGIATGRETNLIDSTTKKMNAVANILKEMDLSNQITTIPMRIEDLANQNSGYYSVLTARALDKLPVVLELASPLLRIGGVLIQFKGIPGDDEYQSAEKVCEIVGMREIARLDTVITHESMKRTLIAYEKIGEPKIQLPRRVGKAQKNPLA